MLLLDSTTYTAAQIHIAKVAVLQQEVEELQQKLSEETGKAEEEILTEENTHRMCQKIKGATATR